MSRAKKDPEGRNIPHEHGPRALAFKYEQALAGVLELRKLHVQLDNAVLGAYGWNQESMDGPALDLQHNFYDVETFAENDRNRFTISPAARKELLARLLKENHRRSASEGLTPTGVSDPVIKPRGKTKKTASASNNPLFDSED